MALVRKSGSQRRTYILLAVLAVGALGTIYYLFFAGNGTGISGGGTVTDPATLRTQADLRSVSTSEQKLVPDLEQLLGDQRFQELHQYGTLPVEVGNVGKTNPFERTF